MTGRGAVLLALALVVAGVAPAALASAAGAVDATGAADSVTTGEVQGETTEITDCTTITESGEYVLAGDVDGESATPPEAGLGACLRIEADDVVLRGQNRTVAGPNRGGVVGVLVGGDARPSNVTVRNLTVTGWGAGVAVMGADDATLRNVSAVANLGDGLYLEDAPSAAVLGGTVRGSNTGVFAQGAPDAEVEDVTVEENIAGIEVRDSDGATVTGVTAEGNRFGVGVTASANATVADATLRANEFASVVVSDGDGADLRNLAITQTARPGAPDPVGVYLNDSDARLADASIVGERGAAVYAAGNSTVAGERVRVGETEISFDARDVLLGSADDPPPTMTEWQVVGDPIRAVPTGEDSRLSVSVGYSDTAVEQARTTEDTLSLWRFDAGEGWERAETDLDRERNTASAEFGELDENETVISLVGEGFAESGNETAG